MSRNFAIAFLTSLFLLTLSGCGTTSREPESEHVVKGVLAEPVVTAVTTIPPLLEEPVVTATTKPPLHHVWSYLRAYGDEPDGYATYSYVLAGRDQSDESHTQRYKALIAAIKGSTPWTCVFPSSVDNSLINIFFIPGMGGDTGALNVGLSMSLVSALKKLDARFNNPGPFIVTLYHPISFNPNCEVTMLFVDLTYTHPDAMAEIATVYKKRISQAPLQGVERLRSLKLALLNAVLVADDRIGFATTAYADLRKAVISE